MEFLSGIVAAVSKLLRNVRAAAVKFLTNTRSSLDRLLKNIHVPPAVAGSLSGMMATVTGFLRSIPVPAAVTKSLPDIQAAATGFLRNVSAFLEKPLQGISAAGSNLLLKIPANWLRVSNQLYFGIGAAVALMMITGLVAFISIDRVGNTQLQLSEGTIPELASAFRVSQLGSELADAAFELASATTDEQLDAISEQLTKDTEFFEKQLQAMIPDSEETGTLQLTSKSAPLRLLSEQGRALITNLRDLEQTRRENLALGRRLEVLQEELAALRTQIDSVLIKAIDDQVFYVITGRLEIDGPRQQRTQNFSVSQFDIYRLLSELNSDVAIAIQTLGTVFYVADSSLLEPLRERLEASAQHIRERLYELPESKLRDRIENVLQPIISTDPDREKGLEVQTEALLLSDEEQELLAYNRTLSAELVTRAEALVLIAREDARTATDGSRQAVDTGRNLLIGLVIISLTGAILISWLFVRRILAHRLERLSESMQRMADGDLKGEVGIEGRDEIASMAATLDVFRRNALEAQRVDLAEKLAEELRKKNDVLEIAFDDLQKAQDQVVMQQKLAALGELTAGVAHEIRNPLNFIKNFAEGSSELMEELVETLDLLKGDDDEENKKNRDLIIEIGEDITENLNRIRDNGTRADRIVQSMLQMGRGSGDRSLQDINALLGEHARLAYHSARATDPDFNVEIIEEMDPDVGEMEVIGQDLGRVFLNLVSNACQATDEKRHALEKEGDKEYRPQVTLISRNKGDSIEVCVRDNGKGVPESAKERIFHPFFTTKPPDKGTGLGLSLSNDIVQAHGGTLKVDSVQDEYTEMTVTLPRGMPPEEEGAGEEDTGEEGEQEESSGEDATPETPPDTTPGEPPAT
ncbi:MAG: ATP-binding protein [Parvularculales bacterium]